MEHPKQTLFGIGLTVLVLLFVTVASPIIDRHLAESHLEAEGFRAVELDWTYSSGRCLKGRRTFALDAIRADGHHVVGFVCAGHFWPAITHVTDDLDARATSMGASTESELSERH
ncbi:hypothetical protein [Caulobacter segnis]|uniref:hypothetical protein n=1 Tax=Caulobacter segnis TaxID=88688 RepID=UPI0028654DA0|nr:hypothetical protein [Caulobacter segnis]MDR6627094.1 hypothetical protein [Caulobacter segnis]